MSEQTLAVNTLPFALKEELRTFPFYEEKQPGMAPLLKREFPEKWKARYIQSAEKLERLYTDFSQPEDGQAPYHIDIELNDAPVFTSHYLHHHIHHTFKDTADFRSTDFINRVEVKFRDKAKDEFSYLAYKRFVLSARRHWYTEGWGLTVRYVGHSYIYPKALLDDDFELSPEQISLIAYNGYIFPYKDIPPNKLASISFDKAYPVVNTEIRKQHGAFRSPDIFANKVKRYYQEIEWLRDKYLSGRGNILPKMMKTDSRGWTILPEERVNRIPASAGKMTFKDGHTELNPFTGMTKHGPFSTSPHRNIRIVFITHEDDFTGACTILYNYLKGNKTYSSGHRAGKKEVPSLKKFTNLPADLSKKVIRFSNDQNPLPEILPQLDRIREESGREVTLFAYYITRVESDEKDPDRRSIYYRLKEELLRRSISSQVVEKSTILGNNFKYSIPNIYTATLAKLGGIPWILNEPPEKQLLVGIGAFKPKDFGERYLGSAICFRNNGTFHGMRCFTEDEPYMLAGSVREAVTRYVSEHGQARRLIIHFYKRMSRKEWKPIMDTLRDLRLDIPVIVLTISKTEFEDTVLFDMNHPHRLPLSGTWFKRGYNDFLLCNNIRYFQNSKVKKGFPFPVRIRSWCSDENLLKSFKEREKLIRQVYQFSRLYWKSVSQQSIPVTVKYPEMVAEMFPWFESLTLPSFGRENLWFL